MSPIALDQFVVKVHSRCDLACDHCYVYEGADQGWLRQPKAMSAEVISRTAERIAEHASLHGLQTVQVVLHGGEPLLAGTGGLRRIIESLHSVLGSVCQLDLRIHTNGVQLNQKFCELFAEYGVKVGVSIDGDRVANDRHRRYANGRSSYDQVVRAIELLRSEPFRHLYAGLLCTIDVANDPIAVYEALIGLRPPRIDFLLPHATWDDPPPRAADGDTEYAGWLSVIFDRWLADGCPTAVRTFESILSTLAGGENRTEALGLAPSSLVVIETDGTYEQVDSLKTAYDGAPATGLNVFSHALDVVGQHPGIVARQQGLAGLSQTCRECRVVASCGGGLYTHRYRSGTGFGNPSVYCTDLFTLITHIQNRLPEATDRRRHVPNHLLGAEEFRQLAVGHGSPAAVAWLLEAQRSLQRALIAAVYRAGSSAPAVPGPARKALCSAWAVLAAADRERPDVLDVVLGHPYLRVWASRCLEHLKPGAPVAGRTTGNGRELTADLGHFGAIAAVTAIRAGDRADVTVPVRNDGVHLPTLGRLVIGPRPDGPLPREAILSIDAKSVSVLIGKDCWEISTADLLSGEPHTAGTFGEGGSAEWQPVRKVAASGISVVLEDTDPYRDCHQQPAAARLSSAEFARWQQSFQDAWHEIQRDFPAHAPSIGAGLKVLMPLSPETPDHDVSATARHAFGAIGAALPADATSLALVILTEFQHVKLSAMTDLYDLCDPAGWPVGDVSGRAGPRSATDLLHDAYATLAVSEYWRIRQQAGSRGHAQRASERYAFWHAHTQAAIEAIGNSGLLTPLGMRFVGEMRRSGNA